MSNYILTIGGTAVDTFYQVEGFPQAGDCVHAMPIGQRAGGCVLNCASVMSALGNKVYELAFLKKDDTGSDAVINDLKKHNVDTSKIILNDEVVNCNCLIMECQNEKTIFVIDAKHPHFEVDDEFQKMLNGASYIYSMMQLCEDSFGSIEPLLEAKKNGTKIIFDAGCQYKNSKEKEILFELASGCFLNTMAYGRLSELCNKEPYIELIENGLDFVCVTAGDKGATCYTKDGSYFQESLPISVVDSTGAGDSFAGCFISCLAKGYTYQKALKLATVNGAYACTVVGGMSGAVDETTLIKFAKDNNFSLE